jgi:O-antigen/teichoic acid export membrane protein
MMLTMLLNNVIDRTLYPAFCRLKDDTDRLRARQQEVLEIYCTLALPLILLVAANADLLIEAVYDPRYADAGLALRWLLVAVAIQGLVRLLNVPIMATGRPYVGTIAALGSLAVLCLVLCSQVVRSSIQGYASARMLASLALVVPVVGFSLKLRHRTVLELCCHLRPVLAMLLALVTIHSVCMYLGDSIGWRIARAGTGALLVTPALLLWQRAVLVHATKEVIRVAPRLPRRSRDTACCKEQLSA